MLVVDLHWSIWELGRYISIVVLERNYSFGCWDLGALYYEVISKRQVGA